MLMSDGERGWIFFTTPTILQQAALKWHTERQTDRQTHREGDGERWIEVER